jgi:hypothetical protein
MRGFIGSETPLPLLEDWRRRSDSNRCIEVLQTSPLPLGYAAPPSLVGSAIIYHARTDASIEAE